MAKKDGSKTLIVDDEVFMKAFAKVFRAGGKTQDVAEALGVDSLYVSRRATALRRQGLPIPKLGRGQSKDWDTLRAKAKELFA